MVTSSDSTDRVKRTESVENAADAYLEAFATNGVEYFFNSPGTEFAPLWDQFADADSAAASDTTFPVSPHGIKYVGCRHEELALHMAMGYALVTGNPQVVGLHVNVGSLHGAMSIHGAYRSRIPMVILTSHADTHEQEQRGGSPGSHYLNFNAPGGFEDHFARYVKWLAHPERTNALRYFARAFRVATSQPRGPVLLNVSRELLYDESMEEATITREVPATPPAPSADICVSIAEKLTAASNPVIISGMTGRNQAAVDPLVTLAERLQAPVMENPKWQNGFPSDNPLYLGARAFLSHYLAKDVDLVLVLDSKRPWYPPEANAPHGAEVIMVSPDPVQIQLDYWNYPVDMLVNGDPAATLEGLIEHIPEGNYSRPVDWPAEHERLFSHWDDYATARTDHVPIDPFWLCNELDRILPADAVIVEETTVHKTLIMNMLGTRERTFIGAGLALAGGRGGGLGIALGAKLALPERPVIAMVGDGAYNYNPVSAALGAAQEHQLPFLTVIFDNSGYQSQKGSHIGSFPDGRAVESDIFPGTSISPRPDYARQAEAWNAYGETVEEPADITSALTKGLDVIADGSAAVLHVLLEEESPRAKLEHPTIGE